LGQVADSTELNGACKMALTRYKRELQALQTRQPSRFLKTDIVQLVRKAWCASISKDKLKFDTAKSGWNPLNYILLDHPNLLRESIASSTNSSASIAAASIPYYNTIDTINQKGKIFNHHLHLFILNEAKKEGRKRNLDEQQKDVANRDVNFSLLSTYTRIAATS
jgi:hypothetical protein